MGKADTFISVDILTKIVQKCIWLVGWLGLKGQLRQYFSLYQAVSHKEGHQRKYPTSHRLVGWLFWA